MNLTATRNAHVKYDTRLTRSTQTLVKKMSNTQLKIDGLSKLSDPSYFVWKTGCLHLGATPSAQQLHLPLASGVTTKFC